MKNGNWGEWGELYALFKLLGDNFNELSDLFPVPRIELDSIGRMDSKNGEIRFAFSNTSEILVKENGTTLTSINTEEIRAVAKKIINDLKNGKEISEKTRSEARNLMEKMKLRTLGANSTLKEDITVYFHDTVTKKESSYGFSVKTEIAGASTLLNPSGSTNIIYKVKGLSEEKIREIIQRTKVGREQRENQKQELKRGKEVVGEIYKSGGSLKYVATQNPVFERNLKWTDTAFPELLSNFVLAHYKCVASKITNILKKGEELKTGNDLTLDHIRHIMGRFLLNVALGGFTAAKEWSGNEVVRGGYIVVKEDGSLELFYSLNRDRFKNHLLKSTSFDSPSTHRHKYGEVFFDDSGEPHIKLNVQIRFQIGGLDSL